MCACVCLYVRICVQLCVCACVCSEEILFSKCRTFLIAIKSNQMLTSAEAKVCSVAGQLKQMAQWACKSLKNKYFQSDILSNVWPMECRALIIEKLSYHRSSLFIEHRALFIEQRARELPTPIWFKWPDPWTIWMPAASPYQHCIGHLNLSIYLTYTHAH